MDAQQNELTFDLARQTVKVLIKNQAGIVQEFRLVELSGADRDAYMNGMASRSTISADGKTQKIRDFKGLQASLVVKALFDTDGNPVSVDEIQTWPARVLQTLFEKVQDMSGLKKEAVEEAKND